MKCIRVYEFGGPEVLKFEEVLEPRPGPHDILVDIRSIGINPVETYQRSGSNPLLKLPWTPGTDAAGIVKAVGSAVINFKVGDRVYTSNTLTGSYAELALCSEKDVWTLPANLSFAQGAAVNIPYATAYRALFQRANVRAGETVLIHGASGGVGTAATQLARASGLTIIGTAGTDAGRKLVAEQGAHHVLDHGQPEYLEQVMVVTGGRGVNIILEMLANANLGKDLPLLATGGRIVVIGSRGEVAINPRELMKRDADIRGMMLFNASESELDEIHAGLRTGLESGTLRPIIGKEMPLSDAALAHRAVMAPGAYGKIVLEP